MWIVYNVPVKHDQQTNNQVNMLGNQLWTFFLKPVAPAQIINSLDKYTLHIAAQYSEKETGFFV